MTDKPARTPSAGDIYAFRTMPLNEDSPPETGRWAAFKVLGRDQGIVVVAVLDRVWTAAPPLNEARGASILRENRFSWNGREAVFGVNVDWWSPSELNDLTFLGTAAVSSREAAIATQTTTRAPGSSHSTMTGANHSAEAEWRWEHDRETFTAEVERDRLRREHERAAREKRYRTRLSKLTWAQLLAETPFERWSPSPPFPPREFTVEARKVIHETCLKLEAIGPKPKKADVRAILKTCVHWFNDADDRAGGVIETEEREDICAVLEELAYVARQKRLVEEIGQWRTW